MLISILLAYILGYVTMFLLLSHSANWFFNIHNTKNILSMSLFSWIGVVAVILIIIYDIEIDD